MAHLYYVNQVSKNRKSLWENYAGIIPDFQMFCDIMDQITDDYTALYVHNATNSNKLEDCIFWYKARPVPPDLSSGHQIIGYFMKIVMMNIIKIQ